MEDWIQQFQLHREKIKLNSKSWPHTLNTRYIMVTVKLAIGARCVHIRCFRIYSYRRNQCRIIYISFLSFVSYLNKLTLAKSIESLQFLSKEICEPNCDRQVCGMRSWIRLHCDGRSAKNGMKAILNKLLLRNVMFGSDDIYTSTRTDHVNAQRDGEGIFINRVVALGH